MVLGEPAAPNHVGSGDWLGHENMSSKIVSINQNAQPSDGSAHAWRVNERELNPNELSNACSSQVCELSELLASPINSINIQNRLVA
jgi:hypothetical protein